MRAQIIRVGNSRGIRIPKVLLNQTGLKDEVEIFAEKDTLVIRPSLKPRSGWDESFRAMANHQDDVLSESMDSMGHSFDEEEWEWK
ncbi:AbrB/MazE/SpoVT family DNA-binding domain-containing protein [bacterium]|nr:AbrB/MazE/SpoVT family DNA-binding domain-containing protein [bacterium]